MEIGILGPLEVRGEGMLVSVGGPKPRALLAALALQAGEVVSRDRLIEALWGERPPRSVNESLDVYVSRLRRVLGRDRVERRGRGYVLLLDGVDLDLSRFEQLVQLAREARGDGEDAAAAHLLREALSLWRGRALADVRFESDLSREAEDLDELRLAAVEELHDAELALGHGADLVGELEALHRENPLRERIVGQLMLALYQGGRQAEALAVYQRARRRLAEELGLEPGTGLRDLERRILQHDPGLDAPRPLARRRDRRARAAMPFATAAIASALILVVGLSRGGGNPTWGGAYPSSALLGLAADSGSVREQISIPSAPSDVAVGVGSVWVTDPSAHRVLRVDPVTRVVIDRIPIGGEPGRLVVAGRAIWVTKTVGGAVARIDPSTGTVSQSVPLEGANVSAIAYGQGWLWAADATNHALVVMDPVAESPRRTIELDLTPSAVAVAPREVWVAGYDQGTVEEIDPVSRQVRATIHVGQGPSALAVYGDSVWVANSLDGTVSRIDRRTDSVEATVPVGSGPSAITASNGAIWVASRYSGTISRIDADSSQIVSTHHVDGQPVGLTVADSQIWVGSAPSTASHTGGTLTIASTDRGRSLDPAFQASSSLLTRLAYDSLVTFEAAPGPAGLRLVPDLALSLPTPSRAGTLYSFKVRPGIRYSNGDLLRARDFRRGIERLFRTSSPGASYFTELVGADACIDGPPRRCDLSHGIATDDAARTVLFRLRAPDPDFLYKLTVLGYSAPVPAGTPDRDLGSSPVPGTGPYRVTRTSGRELRFVRNGFFREWSHAAQPNGNADSIVWRSTPSADAAVGDVEQGRADWVGAVSPGRIDELARSSPAQLHRNPSFAVEFVSLNTRRRPFDDVRVRKALNYALDRAKIARMYGLSVAAPLCQPLAPGLPGYAPYCPYTVHPERDGRWSAPDSARAKRLVAASGTRGEHVDVWAASDQFFIPRRVPRYVTAVLRSLGYRAQLHRIPYARFSPSMRRGIQLSVDGDWVPDYAAPSSYLPQFFGCNGGSNRKHYFCDPRLDRRMRRASALELADPASAAALWENIDHELVDRAVWVPTVNVGVTELVSRRLRNYQYHPVFGFLAAQAWLG